MPCVVGCVLFVALFGVRCLFAVWCSVFRVWCLAFLCVERSVLCVVRFCVARCVLCIVVLLRRVRCLLFVACCVLCVD